MLDLGVELPCGHMCRSNTHRCLQCTHTHTHTKMLTKSMLAAGLHFHISISASQLWALFDLHLNSFCQTVGSSSSSPILPTLYRHLLSFSLIVSHWNDICLFHQMRMLQCSPTGHFTDRVTSLSCACQLTRVYCVWTWKREYEAGWGEVNVCLIRPWLYYLCALG